MSRNLHIGLPELLAPVGSTDALKAAINGGADAVYLGGSSFNARMNAKNFDVPQLSDAVKYAHSEGVSVYLTLNTLIYDREYNDYLRAAEQAALCGVDALIIADLAGADAVHRYIPDLPLHASTQMTGHNAEFGRFLASRGYTRMVPAREVSFEDLKTLTKNSPIETEIFIHGALCVSVSGQCLFSSIVGGRSGNRGECAQPCRLPYSGTNKANKCDYPLSLKDLSLAGHIPEILSLGVESLKIEGRMKSPEYVYTVTSIYRKLLDERRNADKTEARILADAFSRGGFTDGYFKSNIGSHMLGVRSESDKEVSRNVDTDYTKRSSLSPATLSVSIKKDTPITATLTSKGVSKTVTGPVPDVAISSPLNVESVKKSFSKFGSTCLSLESIDIDLDDMLILPVSKMNALRREAADALLSIPDNHYSIAYPSPEALMAELSENVKKTGTLTKAVTARFYDVSTITRLADSYFDLIFVPLDKVGVLPEYCTADKYGVILPPVIYDSEMKDIEDMLNSLPKGINHIMISNLSQLSLAKRYADFIHGDMRLNVTSTYTANALGSMGITDIILSPELTLPKCRDIIKNTNDLVSVMTYGRITLMTLEKCAIKDTCGCDVCSDKKAQFKDRRGMVFPLLREWKHRNILLNSLPTSMTDKRKELDMYSVIREHYVFTTETNDGVDRVIACRKSEKPVCDTARRIAK